MEVEGLGKEGSNETPLHDGKCRSLCFWSVTNMAHYLSNLYRSHLKGLKCLSFTSTSSLHYLQHLSSQTCKINHVINHQFSKSSRYLICVIFLWLKRSAVWKHVLTFHVFQKGHPLHVKIKPRLPDVTPVFVFFLITSCIIHAHSTTNNINVLWPYEHFQHGSFNLQVSPPPHPNPPRLKRLCTSFSAWLSLKTLKLFYNLMSLPPLWIIPSLPHLLRTCSSLRHQINKEINNNSNNKKNPFPAHQSSHILFSCLLLAA